jgi:small-conductance mechanosensitive channel
VQFGTLSMTTMHPYLFRTTQNFNLLIASDPKKLIPTLQDAIGKLDVAIQALESSNSPLTSDEQNALTQKKDSVSSLKNALKEAEDVKYVDLNKITAQYRTGQNHQAIQQAREQEIKKGLANIANKIQQVGSYLGIKDLDELKGLRDYFQAPPKERYLPIPSGVTASQFIRSKLYDGWASVRNVFYQQEQPKVIQKIQSVKAMPDGAAKNTAWRQMKSQGFVEQKCTGAISAYNPNSIKYEVDHITSIARMWNDAGAWGLESMPRLL